MPLAFTQEDFLVQTKFWNILLPELVTFVQTKDRPAPGDDGDEDLRLNMEFRLRHGLDTSEVNFSIHFIPFDLLSGVWIRWEKYLF